MTFLQITLSFHDFGYHDEEEDLQYTQYLWQIYLVILLWWPNIIIIDCQVIGVLLNQICIQSVVEIFQTSKPDRVGLFIPIDIGFIPKNVIKEITRQLRCGTIQICLM